MGELIDFAQARRRLAATEEPESETLADYWLRDLETWPTAFQQKLRGNIEALCDPKFNVGRSSYGVGRVQASRNRVEGETVTQFMREFVNHVQFIHDSAAKLRRAREQGLKAYIVTRWWAELEGEKRELLELLWLFDFRKLKRSDFEGIATEDLREERESLRSYVAHESEQVERLRALLCAGVYTKGPKAGRPYSTKRREQLEREAEGRERELRRYEQRLALIESERDVLRAWGLYAVRPGAQSPGAEVAVKGEALA